MGLEQYTTKKRIICFPPWPVIYFLILIPPYHQGGELVTYWDPCIGLSPIRIHAKGWRSYIEEFRGSEMVKCFWCKFIFRDCRVQGQRFCNRSKTSLYYSELLFRKVSPQVFYCEICLLHWFSWVIISCLIYYSTAQDINMILMFVYFNKIYS